MPTYVEYCMAPVAAGDGDAYPKFLLVAGAGKSLFTKLAAQHGTVVVKESETTVVDAVRVPSSRCEFPMLSCAKSRGRSTRRSIEAVSSRCISAAAAVRVPDTWAWLKSERYVKISMAR